MVVALAGGLGHFAQRDLLAQPQGVGNAEVLKRDSISPRRISPLQLPLARRIRGYRPRRHWNGPLPSQSGSGSTGGQPNVDGPPTCGTGGIAGGGTNGEGGPGSKPA